MMEQILIFTAFVLISYLEGLREFYFYEVNRKGKFPDRESDLQRKQINAVLFFVYGLYIFLAWSGLETLLEYAKLMFVACSIRWIVLDGVLNRRRGLHFFYAGNVSKMDRLISTSTNYGGSKNYMKAIVYKGFALALSLAVYYEAWKLW